MICARQFLLELYFSSLSLFASDFNSYYMYASKQAQIVSFWFDIAYTHSFWLCCMHFPSFRHSNTIYGHIQSDFLLSYSKAISIRSHIEMTKKEIEKKNNNSNALRCHWWDGWSANNGIVIDVRKREELACVTSLYYVMVWLFLLLLLMLLFGCTLLNTFRWIPN